MITKDQAEIIIDLVGELSGDQMQNIQENLDFFVHKDLSVFVPVFKYCDYAVSPSHSHPAYSFIYNIKTKGKLVVEGVEVNLPKGLASNICAFSPSVEHQEIMEDGFSSYLAVFVRKEKFESLLSKFGIAGSVMLKGNFFPPDEEVLYLLKTFMNEVKYPSPGSELVLDTMVNLLISKFIRISCKLSKSEVTVSIQQQIDRAVNYMYENIEKKLSVDMIAEVANLSTSHFSRLFKQVTQKTPIEFLTKIRIEKAKRLLRYGKLNLTEIAFDCGFSSSSYFTHTFIEELGMTPSEYRKMC